MNAKPTTTHPAYELGKDLRGLHDVGVQANAAINAAFEPLVRGIQHSMLNLDAGFRSAPKPVSTPRELAAGVNPALLPEALQSVYDLLNGRVLSAKEIASHLDDGTKEGAVFKRIGRLKSVYGIQIANQPGQGYYRLDAPPM